jgi:hypothetical protein
MTSFDVDGAVTAEEWADDTTESEDKKNDAPSVTEAPSQTTATETIPVKTLDEVVEIFQQNLYLPDPTVLYAVLGAVAANRLDGDPVWLLVVGPPSSGKTEVLSSLSDLGNVHLAATLTEGSLLSGTAQKEHAQDAKGGLLREIGEFGIILAKDFGSVLSMNHDARAQMLAALREIYDGSWTRRIGMEGGRKLHWEGKVGLIGGCTPAFDKHHAVISAMGDRFLLFRLGGRVETEDERQEQASQVAGSALDGSSNEDELRRQNRDAVAGLFAGIEGHKPRKTTAEEKAYLITLAILTVRCRSAVLRDRQSREIDGTPQPEAPARIVKQFERLLAGLDVIGLDRDTALRTITRVALDNIPPMRREVLAALYDQGDEAETTRIAEKTDLPSTPTRRTLEDLTALHVVKREPKGQGKADLWTLAPWARASHAEVYTRTEAPTFPAKSDTPREEPFPQSQEPPDGSQEVSEDGSTIENLCHNHAPSYFAGTPPSGGSNGRFPTREGFNGAKPQPVNEGWNQAEQEALLDEALRQWRGPDDFGD